MSPQFNENLLIKMYIEVDDLHLAYLAWRTTGILGKARRPTRKRCVERFRNSYHHSRLPPERLQVF